MSYNQPYRSAPDDKDLRMYPREASGYRSGIRGTSPPCISSSSSELPVFPPNKALSFLHSCGLDAEDLQTLAKLPEHLITTETLPDLLAEIKKKKLSNTPSRSGALSASSSARSWDERSHAQSVEYPLDLPDHQSYSLNREHAQTWDDRWGDVQQTSSTAAPSYVVEYNHLKEKKPYYDEQSYATESSRGKSSAVSQSYYGRDVGHSSHLSSRDIGQSSHLSSRDSQSSHRSSRDISQSSQLSSRYISQSSQRSSRDVTQSSQMSSRGVGLPSVLSSRDVGVPSLLSSRDIISPSTLSNRNLGIPSLLSMRDLAPSSRLSSRDSSQPSWRNDTAPKVPTRKEASDFHGRTPPVFPYACMLCEITVLSNKDWSVHIKGPQHANSQLILVEKYPAWDQTIRTARRNETESSARSKSRTTQERDRTSSSRNGSSASRSETSSSRTTSSSKTPKKIEAPSKCKVVSVKFEVDGVDEAYLKQLLGQFGAIVKLIMFPRLALVEMGTPGQAEDIVKYFLQNPLKFKGVLLEFSLSAAFSFLQSSRVVSFSPLPSGDGVSSELTAIAKRFGSVKNSLFLPSRGYVEMALVEEANKLVDHYSTNSLKLKGKTISVAFSSEYQSLGDMDTGKDKSPTYSSSSSRRRRRSYSPRRSSRRGSPSPKRRTSEAGSKSSRSHDSNKQDKSRRSHTTSRHDSSSKSHSKRSSPSKDQKLKTEKEGEEEKVEDDNCQSDNVDGDSDLEGVAVIADDGEELNSEDELTVDEDIDDEMHDILDDLNNAPEDMQIVSESNDQIIPSNMDASETAEGEQTAITLEKLSEGGNEEAQESQQEEKKELQEENELQQGELKENQQEEQKEIGQEEQKETQQGVEKQLQREEQNEELQEKEEQKENIQQEQQKEELQEKREEQKEHQQGEQKEDLQQEKQKEEHKENLQQGEQKEDLQQEKQKEEHKEELQQGEQKDETVAMQEEAAESSENLEQTEQGDEKEISTSSSEEKYGRVLEVAGFPVAKKYSEADLMKIGEKYGDVAGCCLVRSNRKVEKALIEMVNAADAAKLEAECKRQHIKLGGKILRIKVSQEYRQLNEGNSIDSEKTEVNEPMNAEAEPLNVEEKSTEPACLEASIEESTTLMAETESSEEAETQMETNMDSIMQTSSDEEEVYGRVLRIRNLPMPDEYTDADFLSIAEPYGTVKRHWMFRLHRTGLIEMENASDADKVLSAANTNKITVAGKHPKISVSTKHSHLNKRYFLQASSELEKMKDESNTVSAKEPSNDNQVSAADDGTKAKNSDSVSETQTVLLDPVGMEFVRPVVGYFCNLCNAIYANEEEAKGEHCRTPLHHQKLKEHNERNSSA